MKTLISLFAALLSIYFITCQPSSDKNGKPSKRTDTTKAQTIPEDPDTTDQSPVTAYLPESYRKDAVEMARTALREKFRNELKLNQIDESSRKFSISEYDLNGDGKKEIFVAPAGDYFCDPRGCMIFLLNQNGQVITQFSASATPIVIGQSRTNGWDDLYIKSNGQFHVVKFSEGKYPSNPASQPASKIIFKDSMHRVLDIEHLPYPRFSF